MDAIRPPTRGLRRALLGALFAGLAPVAGAAAPDAAASLAQAEALIEDDRAAAEAGDEIIVELTGVIDDPFAAA